MWCENREEASMAGSRGKRLGIQVDGPGEPMRRPQALVKDLGGWVQMLVQGTCRDWGWGGEPGGR